MLLRSLNLWIRVTGSRRCIEAAALSDSKLNLRGPVGHTGTRTVASMALPARTMTSRYCDAWKPNGTRALPSMLPNSNLATVSAKFLRCNTPGPTKNYTRNYGYRCLTARSGVVLIDRLARLLNRTRRPLRTSFVTSNRPSCWR